MMYLAYSLLTLHMLVGIFLIGLILLQRGRGGGLAGAFGGMGGQSAFGTKAGDIFTRITIAVAVFWILLACACILVVNAANKGRFKPGAAAVNKAPAINALPEDGAAKPENESGDDAKSDDAKSIVPPSPDKAEQLPGTEKKSEANDDKSPEAKKPVNTDADPAAAPPDASKDKETSAPPEKSDTKKNN
jgi:preprotein translocase subunit SecG